MIQREGKSWIDAIKRGGKSVSGSWRLGSIRINNLWMGPKVLWGFRITSYGKTTSFLVSPVIAPGTPENITELCRGNILATSCEELTHWKNSGCWEGLGAGGEGDDRGWDGWMASPTRWTWVWVNSGNWWWTGRPGVLWFMGSQRVGHDWATKLNWSTRLCLLGSYLLMEIQKITLCRVAHWLETSEVSKCLHSKNIRTCWYMNILNNHLLHFLCLECKLTYVLIRL